MPPSSSSTSSSKPASPVVKILGMAAALLVSQLVLGLLVKAKWAAVVGGVAGGLVAVCLALLLTAVGVSRSINWPVAAVSAIAAAVSSSLLLHQSQAVSITLLASAVLFSGLRGYAGAGSAA